MPDLLAEGSDPVNTWRRPLTPEPIILGRAQKCDWEAPWDEHISRRHARIQWKDGKLHVTHLPEGKNPIFYQGKELREFTLGLGEHFIIGKTSFKIVEGATEHTPTGDAPAPIDELTCSFQELRKIRYADAADRIEALAKLPGLIRFSPSDEELETRVIEVLLDGILRAGAAAIVHADPARPSEPPQISIARGRGGMPTDLKPSRRLIFEACRRRRLPVMHTWNSSNQSSGEFTASAEIDWALCAPLPDVPEPGWALYITGKASTDLAKKEDLKFAGLVADLFGALRQVRDLQKRKAIFESFLSPTVLAALANQDMDQVLRPRRSDVTVLFCDLRGSCRIAERDEALETICDRVSEALGIMTRNILDKDGVIGDFQGDAAMGFWGWPLDTEDQVEQAARAALAIRREFHQTGTRKDHPLANFECGIGIAHGPAIAGRLGTLDQIKVGVFGPVVNLASRLESMTKTFRVPILMDDQAAAKLKGTKFRMRRLVQARPYGMERVVGLHELMIPRHEAGAMSELDQGDFDAAVENFQAGRWVDARMLLDRLRSDGPAQFLRGFMDENQGKPPAKWDGLVVMKSK